MNCDWKSRREGGSMAALWLLRTIAQHGGRRLARVLLLPITLYFLARRHAERRDSRAYLARVLDRRPTLWHVARHIHTFAATILDRLFLLLENTRRFAVDVSGLEPLHRHLDAGRGVLVFGSHLGSFEVLRVLSRQRPNVKVRVVLDKAHSAMVTQVLDALNPDVAATVIDAGQDGPSIVMAIKAAAEEGALVALLVDRVHAGEPHVHVPFLGAPAAFPTSPWLIAAVLKLPVVLAFGLYRGGNRYDLCFENFSEGVDIPRVGRAQAIAALIQRYAERLEHHVRSAPYNWFNFYDFWKRNDDPSTPASTVAPLAPDVQDDPARGLCDASVQRRTALRRAAAVAAAAAVVGAGTGAGGR